ncbi:type VII secretion target [Micromonospora marina]|uniref:Excreted virulence factor EspC, type VII ESX diderm n=1 Tax=Micromonospora marina TaxID=307120 RepID=A0A1C4YH75_9ACTN|nr:type VII secretion target [Micromonospora marina]SCF20073.1 Excreted virulence factor EspC, type VII ESX diderm [Micromonospora marina]
MTSPSRNLDAQPEALRAFAAASRDRSSRFRELERAFRDGHVARHSFGVMPASFSLAAAYEQQFEACLQGLADGAETMLTIATGLTETAAAYDDTDAANDTMFTAGG